MAHSQSLICPYRAVSWPWSGMPVSRRVKQAWRGLTEEPVAQGAFGPFERKMAAASQLLHILSTHKNFLKIHTHYNPSVV